ncbi:uncharacterized protein BXIN_0232 [Babesia sp. Xinjiang]|uniref:uncharacterized protein n=1 Tax=Babesia sp. Xinjiang TaxID=462227 RepID=UPI000A254E2D|nr:uncharacterized protein BXIN_0232 [Babesia sp. Xinjiang]ORM39876.1 hypothetical protein BXIN_0232 [Babesia sp. Xinjiang]
MATTLSGRYAFHEDFWKENYKLTKSIDAKVQQLTKLGFCKEHECQDSIDATRAYSNAEEVFEGPRIYIDNCYAARNICQNINYLDKKQVRSYFQEQGIDIEEPTCEVIFQDHKIREVLEHLSHLVSLTEECKDPDPTAFVFKQTPKKGSYVTPADDKQAVYNAYDTDFKIRYKSPEHVKAHHTAAAPSLYHLYDAVADGVERVISADKENEETNFDYLEKACNQIELFTGATVSCVEIVRDILQDYSKLKYVSLSKEITKGQTQNLKDVIKTVTAVNKEFVKRGAVKQDLGISLSPGGFFLSMFIGFVDQLIELNVINMTTPMAGSSAGSLAAAATMMYGVDRRYMMNVVESLCALMMEGPPTGTLDRLVMKDLHRIVSPGTYKTMNERIGTVRINFAEWQNRSMIPRYIIEARSDKELIDALRSSCNVPGFSRVGGINFRGAPMYDGVFSTDGYFLGTTKAAGRRTVRFMPMPVGYGRKIKKNLQNDIVNSLLQKKDKYFIYFLRLKSLIKQLLARRIQYQNLDMIAAWREEIALSIKVYNAAVTEKKGIKAAAGSIGQWVAMLSRQPGETINGNNVKQDCRLIKLFKLVVASEITLNVGPCSTNHAGGFKGDLSGVCIMRTFGDPLYPKKTNDVKMVATPHTLLEWLIYEESLLDRKTNVDGMTAVEEEIIVLGDLMHHLTPPPSLTYYYTDFPYLLLAASVKLKNIVPAFYAQQRQNVRHMLDVGRAISYRWVLGEYIAFENWIYLRIKQLKENPKSSMILRNGDLAALNDLKNKEWFEPIHMMQHKRLNETIQLLDKTKVEELFEAFKQRKGSVGTSKVLFEVQNRLVRRAMLYNVVTHEFTHILGHKHFWIN